MFILPQPLATQASLDALAAGVPTFIGPFTRATLPTPTISHLGLYATVTDLFGGLGDGGVSEVVRCRQVGASFYWVPQRTSHAAPIAGNVDMTLGALSSPPSLILTGAFTAQRTYTLSTQGAYPGAPMQIINAGSGLFSATLAGLALGSTLGLILGAKAQVVFDGTAWRTTT